MSSSSDESDETGIKEALEEWAECLAVVKDQTDTLVEEVLTMVKANHRNDPNVSKIAGTFEQQMRSEHAKLTTSMARTYQTHCLLSSDHQLYPPHHANDTLKYYVKCTYTFGSENPALGAPVKFCVDQTLQIPYTRQNFDYFCSRSSGQSINSGQYRPLVPFRA